MGAAAAWGLTVWVPIGNTGTGTGIIIVVGAWVWL
jgi:hypothetical protein